MYIKSIILDGFKSYGNRTEIQGFDKEFNAITGLNGTGKSNILDAICFVLGITNLSNVRATSLQDLVYKSGQAGVNKASVSITFDNRDKNQCPIGYQEYDEFTVTRQVVMGGKNKYLLNGTTVQNKRIQDLFCSVQLNVNNPHFLIMQGRITKVLNMKPPEILSMVEESAGTKMYETKRSFAAKTIEKKDAKLNEMTVLINEEIYPKIERLREERRVYFEFQRIERELQHMNGKFTAWQYIQAGKMVEHANKELEANEAQMQEINDKIDENKRKAVLIDEEVTHIQQQDSETGEKMKEIELKVKEKEKIFAKAKAEAKSSIENVTGEEKKHTQLLKNVKDDEKALKAKEKEMSGLNDMFQTLKDAEANDSSALAIAQKKFEALSAGMEIGDDGEAATLQEQLINAKQLVIQASTEAKQSSMKLQFCQSQLKIKQQELGSTAADYKKDKNNLDNIEKEVKTIEKQLGTINYDENKLQDLQDKRRQLMQECRTLRDKIDRFHSYYPQADFQYKDPESNFNRRSVKGLVCKLFNLKDKTTATALETAAGGRLFNVIVESDVTSKKLLQRGQLQHRTTFIPLNKIKGSTIPNKTVKFAENLVGKENVQSALSLIEFNKELQPAIEYIFGGVFICRDMNVAKKVTFHENIRRKCVTLEGDVTDPSGTLSGGARQKGASLLLQLEEQKQLQAQLSAKEQELAKSETEIQNMSQVAEKYRMLKQRYELKSHELSLVQQRLQQTTHYQQQAEIDNLKTSIVELGEKIKRCEQQESASAAKAKDLEANIKNSKGNKEQKLKDAESEVKKLKKQAENSKNHWQQKEQDYEALKLEITELQKAIITGQEQIVTCETTIVELKQAAELANTLKDEAQEETDKIQNELKHLKQSMNAKNKEVQHKLQGKAKLLAEISELELEIKKQSHSINELKNKYKDSKAREANLEKNVKKDDMYLKGAEEMSDKEGHSLGKKIAVAQEQRNKMSRTVNLKAQSMFDQEEKTYKYLVKKKGTVEADKKKFLSLIADIDQKKTEALTKACEQISKDFGSIFSMLLPGANSKLQPPEGKTVLEGLEIKVSLGGIWKDSLSELSGGQKSLIALSLILAMLLYKPAPIYILDEVDAALDLSHTQNIGNMLKKHFKHSQFVIVSLKDGMFSNANVLFRTRFVDGMSAVQRTVNTSNR